MHVHLTETDDMLRFAPLPTAAHGGFLTLLAGTLLLLAPMPTAAQAPDPADVESIDAIIRGGGHAECRRSGARRTGDPGDHDTSVVDRPLGYGDRA